MGVLRTLCGPRYLVGVITKQYTSIEVAEIARQHIVTVRLRLENGELHGSQRRPGGRWLIAEGCLDAYLRGEQCEHRTAPRLRSL
ncbi:helix-turn-helix domain-containing protein [uncultured Microbacterium sp.]|uniref:helix-turn-helix domain-containing protein n=1 Tax=uncultured Microbacterium sp. TaxID=191216 RepID=UPI0034596715